MPARNGQQSVVYLIGSILGGYTAISKRRTTCQATGGNGTSGKATGQGARVVTVGSQREEGAVYRVRGGLPASRPGAVPALPGEMRRQDARKADNKLRLFRARLTTLSKVPAPLRGVAPHLLHRLIQRRLKETGILLDDLPEGCPRVSGDITSGALQGGHRMLHGAGRIGLRAAREVRERLVNLLRRCSVARVLQGIA